MKLAIETYALRAKFGDEQALRLIKSAGFDGVDYSFYYTSEDSPIVGEGYLEHARKVRGWLDECGLTCRQAHAPFRFVYGEAMDESEPHYREIVRAMEAASVLGVEQIIVHSVRPPKEEDTVAYNLQYFKSFEPYCARFGVRIAVENLFMRDKKRGCFRGRFATPASLCDFVRLLGSPHFVACIDVGHAALTGMEPEDFIDGMEPGVLKALHIQDTDYRDDRHVLPYMADLNWDGIMSALRRIGYDGELTFEVFHFFERVPEGLVPEALRYAAAVGRYLTDRAGI
ncbi:MAG: TIM barrel protein [Clostridia bacterium]|nr:TIM barrel protein [Clostridia bacterium]